MSQPPAPQASQVLREEHQVILRVLNVLDRLMIRYETVQAFEADAFRQCVEFFRLFADACHHGKEEDLLFPVLESRGIPRDGGPIGVMLHEHRLGRQCVGRMAAALDAHAAGDAAAPAACVAAGHDFAPLLRAHIHKEDNILFFMGDRVMADADQEELAASFCQVNCRHFQGRTREQLRELADALEQRWATA
jgi:hemerythrin-like domain-containing protein